MTWVYDSILANCVTFVVSTINFQLVVMSKKKSKFKDIIQIKVDHPPSYPNFDNFFFWQFLIR